VLVRAGRIGDETFSKRRKVEGRIRFNQKIEMIIKWGLKKYNSPGKIMDNFSGINYFRNTFINKEA